MWLKKAGNNFREKELLRISKIINLIKNMPELKNDLVAIMARQSSDEKHKDHLDRLRINLLALFNKNARNDFFIELLRTLFNLMDVDLSEITDLGNFRFQLDYEELSEICAEIDNKAINNDLEKNLENSIKSQIKKDEELAKKIQGELWKEIESSGEDKESKKDLNDPFLWQIHAYYEAIFEKIENLTSLNFRQILEQLVVQIEKINKDKLVPQARAVREEIKNTLIGHFEATLSYLFKNPQIGTSEPLDDIYVYTNTHHFGKWLSEFSGLTLDLDGIRQHLDTQLKAYSYRWKKDLLWQLHMEGHTSSIFKNILSQTPINKISSRYLEALFKYEKIKNTMIQINELEIKALQTKEQKQIIDGQINTLKNKLCDLIEDLICRKRRQYCVYAFRHLEKEYIKKSTEEENEEADDNYIEKYQEVEEERQDLEENPESNDNWDWGGPISPSSPSRPIPLSPEPGFYEGEENKAFLQINQLSNLITISGGEEGLNWLVRQMVEDEFELSEFILENLNYDEIDLKPEQVELIIQSQSLYRVYDDSKLDNNFIGRAVINGINQLKKELTVDDTIMQDVGENPISTMRKKLLSTIREKYRKDEEELSSLLGVKEIKELHMEYNKACKQQDFMTMQKVWARFTSLQRRLHFQPIKKQTKKRGLDQVHEESKSRVENYYTRLYPTHNTRYLIYSSKNKNRSKVTEIDLFPFFAKLALMGQKIKDKITQCGSDSITKPINVVTVFLCFVVSTKPHKKGGDHERKFIPINLDLEYKNSLLSKDLEDKVFPSNPAYFYEQIKKDHHHGSSLIYGEPKNPDEYKNETDKILQATVQTNNLLYHSERNFFEVIRKKENLQKIILLLKQEMIKIFGIKELQPGLYKIYSMAVLLYSTNSVCEYCTPGIVAMQNSHEEGFIKSLLQELNEIDETKKNFKVRGCYTKDDQKKSSIDPTKFKALTLVTSDKAFTPQARDTEDKASSIKLSNPKAKLFFYNKSIDLHNANTRCFVEYVGLEMKDKPSQMPLYYGVSFMSRSKKQLNGKKLDGLVKQLIENERKGLGSGKQ